MSVKILGSSPVALRLLLTVAVVLALTACFSGSKRPEPAALTANPGLIAPRMAWSAQVGRVDTRLDIGVSGRTAYFVGADGVVVALDANSGRELWRSALGVQASSGVGSDGIRSAVVTRTNELVVLEAGRTVWRTKLSAQAYLAPLVAAGRVFVLTADRAVTAWDAQTGQQLWTQRRPNEPLVLRQPGVMLVSGNVLLVGLSGRLVALQPDTGNVRWEAPIASPRGVNDVERLVDLVGPADRQIDSVCARAFQATVGCVDPSRGTVQWSQAAYGLQGIAGDANRVYGTESDGKLVAWRRSDGQRLWSQSLLSQRGLSAPVVLGASVAVADAAGFVHWFSASSGALLGRVSTDGSAIEAPPVLVDDTLVVLTRNGMAYGFVPQ